MRDKTNGRVKPNRDPIEGALHLVLGDVVPNVEMIKGDNGPLAKAEDVAAALGAGAPEVVVAVISPEHRQQVDGVWYVDEAGIYEMALAKSTDSGQFTEWVAGVVLPSVRERGRFAPRSQRTRWGWQPIRDVLKVHHMSSREFVEAANALDVEDVGHFTEGNFAAWSYGGCLPAESLAKRAEILLKVSRDQLFTREVVAHMANRGRGKRHNEPVDEKS